MENGALSDVVGLYAEDAVLLPTLSNQIRLTSEDREDYLRLFLSHKPNVTIDSLMERKWGQVVILSGIYLIRLKGIPEAQAARFSFIFVQFGKGDTDWAIKEHHSSWMPERR